MGFRDDMNFQHLLHLQQDLMNVCYDRLNLINLDKLRTEVDKRVAEIIARGKIKRGIEKEATNDKSQGVILLMIMLLITTVGIAIGCEESRGSIEGRVFNKDGTPVAEAVIRAEKSGYPGVLLKTDEDGYYSINNVFTGKWEVEFYDSSGWQVGLESVTVRANETTRLDFTISVKPPPEHPAKININAGK